MENIESLTEGMRPEFEVRPPLLRVDDVVALSLIHVFYLFLGWLSFFHQLVPVVLGLLLTDAVLLTIYFFSYRRQWRSPPFLGVGENILMIYGPDGWRGLGREAVALTRVFGNVVRVPVNGSRIYIFASLRDARRIRKVVHKISIVSSVHEKLESRVLESPPLLARNFRLSFLCLLIIVLVGFSPDSRRSMLIKAVHFQNNAGMSILGFLGTKTK